MTLSISGALLTENFIINWNIHQRRIIILQVWKHINIISKEPWKHPRTLIKWCGNKHDITDCLKYKGKIITDPNKNSWFSPIFSNIGKILVENILIIPKCYVNPLSIFYSPTDIEEIKKII